MNVLEKICSEDVPRNNACVCGCAHIASSTHKITLAATFTLHDSRDPPTRSKYAYVVMQMQVVKFQYKFDHYLGTYCGLLARTFWMVQLLAYLMATNARLGAHGRSSGCRTWVAASQTLRICELVEVGYKLEELP